ncbi:hypothetical protein [Paracoccus aestuariivivens]|uniref:Sulfotransferase family protein n=1 Tax=Paracoccus aestuariivivens TaxID=1820333 RepID=A0A6L6J5C6_9RHOB|nr:hypothetical protein [Paracoccus aestuariivivens]MTH76458.1 hypothetical protein [Paracoccus aestuariivivens]
MPQSLISSSKRRMIVHLGVQKTGSTAIQRFLNQNAKTLADRVTVRTPVKGSSMPPLGRAALAYSLGAGGASHAAALSAAWRDVLDGLPANDLPVLLSHENLAGAMPGNGGETRLYPLLPEIASLLSDQTPEFDVHFVIYTREMSNWKPSVWAQAIRTDGYTGTEGEFLTEVADLPDWDDLRARMVATLGALRISFLRLEDETETDRPGRQLLKHVGFSDPEIDALTPMQGLPMQRLNTGSTEFLRQLNGLALNPHARSRVAGLVARSQELFTAATPSKGTL